MSDIIEQIQPLWTSDWTLQPGNLISLALDPRASVEPLLDRAAILEARLMRPHRVAALVDVVDGDWAQVMLVGIHDGTKKRKYEPSIPLPSSPCNKHPTLVVYPLRRYTVRVGKLHEPAGFAVPVLEAELFNARVTTLGVALHGRKCRTTAARRWELEEAAKQMYALPQDIRLHEDEDEDDASLGVVPCVEVWPEFELNEVWEPDALVSDLNELDEIEIRKYERDAQANEHDSAREHGAAMLRTLKLIRHWQAPAPGESVKTFLRRTFQKTQLYPIEDSDTDDDELPAQRRPSAFRPARVQSAGLLEGVAYCVRWVWNAVAVSS
ncbi:hypothetical protein AURDEDRAFT_128396 [Auricularia subglabra TFB-10046 SS5]|nr:hypothetical protein AURDEDRAFT_128396 [Auricularia subglabra TFB-10046 SS5]